MPVLDVSWAILRIPRLVAGMNIIIVVTHTNNSAYIWLYDGAYIYINIQFIWLVVSTYPSEKYEFVNMKVTWDDSSINLFKSCSKPPTSIF